MSTDERAIHRFVTEKKLGLGEDANPLARHIPSIGDAIGVFDGMGGAGSMQVPDDNEKDMCSMARLASKHAETAVGSVLDQWGKDDLGGLKAQLDLAITKKLQVLAERKGGKGPERRMRGTILALYPTTVALAIVRPSKDEFGSRRVHVFWAGDSRVYAFDPGRLIPLQVLTRDHIDSGEGGDAALARYASAEKLDLDQREFLLPPAASVMAMTDGCYGYMSHFHLMYLLMSKMVRSRNVEEWIERIKFAISAVAGDDTGFALTLGEGGFAALKQRVEPLLDQLEPLAHLVETSPPNSYVMPYKNSAYYELVDEDDLRREAANPELPVDAAVTPLASGATETLPGIAPSGTGF